MNKYIVPIYNKETDHVYTKTYLSCSLSSCQDKIMSDYGVYGQNWFEFIKDMSDKLLFGEIKDIEEL